MIKKQLTGSAAPVKSIGGVRKRADNKHRLTREFLATVTDTFAKLSTSTIDVPTDWHAQVKRAELIRNTDASSIIDLMVAAANSGIEIQAGADLELLMQEIAKGNNGGKPRGPRPARKQANDKQQKFKEVCDYWATYVNSDILGEEPGLDRLNETFYEEIWGGSGIWVSQYLAKSVDIPGLGKYVLPMQVMIHNPEILEIQHGVKFNERSLQIGAQGSRALEIRSDKQGISTWQVLSGTNTPQLVKNNLIIVQAPGKKQYHSMPRPYLMRVADIWAVKQTLFESDHDVAKNILAAMLMVKTGLESEGVEPDELRQLAKDLAGIVENIDTQKLRYYATGPTTKMEWITPPSDTLIAPQKYFQVNFEFLWRLGIMAQPSSKETVGGVTITSILPLLNQIGYGRQKCKRMNERYLDVIKAENKEFADLKTPNVWLKRMHHLEDPASLKAVLQNLFDRGLGWKFMLDEFGYDISEAIKWGAWERDNQIEDILKPRKTYVQGSDGRPPTGEQPKPDVPAPKDLKPKVDRGGSPNNSDNPQSEV